MYVCRFYVLYALSLLPHLPIGFRLPVDICNGDGLHEVGLGRGQVPRLSSAVGAIGGEAPRDC